MSETRLPQDEIEAPSFLHMPTGRKAFLKTSAAALAFSALACNDDDPMQPDGDGDAVALGTGDVGILNYALALEHLEAAFWSQVVDTPYAGAEAAELQTLTDIRDHEVAHREFLRAALGPDAIEDIELDFSAVDFDSRDSVLTAAMTFEDLGVAAYNGAGQLLENPDFLVVAGKIVSVEARHAAIVRSLRFPETDSFAGDDVVGLDGLGRALSPVEVLDAAADFIVTELDASGLPTA